ncbi:zinc finger protein RFP-like isoform X2 [Aphelocoma coerulescens]|uniref:zinc finger protein RFP-like isoform X2 n=1 Tax=Aphelocoma coerulescens TaxID=39617 RepID=UPI0036051AA2
MATEREPEKPIVPEGLKRVGNPGKGSSSPQLSSRDRREMSPHAVPEIKKGTVKEQTEFFENQGKGSSSPQLLARDGREIPPHAVPEIKKGTVKEQTEFFENQGRRVEENKRAMEDMLKQNLHEIPQQMQALQEAFRRMQDSTRCDLEHLKTHLHNEQGRRVEENKRAMEDMLKQNLHEIPQQMQALQEAFRRMQDSTRCDLEHLKTHLHNEQGRRVEENKRAMEDMLKQNLHEISQQMQTLQEAFRHMQDSTRRDLEHFKTHLHNEQDRSELLSYKGDVTLDADTAHPRLEISTDGQKVKDTGVIRQVPSNEKRFDSHLFVLAKEGYTSGKHYWEVSVGRRRSWALGLARESVTRKGPLTLCPQNGFWAIGLADGRDCWAYTDRWTRLNGSGHLHKIGIFLNIPAKQVTFYHADKRAALHTFSIGDGSSQEGKFIPFFSTGPVTAEPDPEPLLIV